MTDVGSDRLVLLSIGGMHSHRCEEQVARVLRNEPEVREVEVDFPSAQASVLVGGRANLQDVVQRFRAGVERSGYVVEQVTELPS